MTQRRKIEKGIREIRPGVYELRVSLGFNHLTGKYDMAEERFEGTLPQARQARNKLVAKVGSPGMRAGLTDMTVTDAIDLYLDALADPTVLPRVGKSTIDNYTSRLRRDLGKVYGDRLLKSITPADLTKLYTARLQAGARDNTVNTLDKANSAFFNWCKRSPRHWIDTNPSDDADHPPEESGHIGFPTVDQLKAIIAKAEQSRNPDNAVLYRFAADTGMRLGEIAALRWRDVDLERGRVWVHSSMPNRFTENKTKTRKDRTITIGADTVAVLRKHRTNMEKLAANFGTELIADARVFSLSVDGSEARGAHSVSARFGRTAAAIGYHGTFHTLRHFMVTQWLTAGYAPYIVAQRAGHSLATMLRVYAHWIVGADADGADALGGLLDD